MQEFRSPALAEIDSESNITDMLLKRLSDAPNAIAYERKVDSQWQRVALQTFHAEVVGLSKGLKAIGIQPGDRISIMSRTRYEWAVIDFAIWFVGGVSVPVYETSSPEQLEWIVKDSGSKAIFLESREHLQILEAIEDSPKDLIHSWVLEDGALDTLKAAGVAISDDEIEATRAASNNDSLATIIYTSGTTGRPKGAELTHGNFVGLTLNIAPQMHDVLHPDPECRTLLFIPLAHVFARLIQVVCVPAGVVVGHSPDVKNLMADLASFKPTFILAVPRVFEKVYNSAEQKAAADGKLKLRIFRLAAAVAIGYSRTVQEAGKASLWWNVKRQFFDILVYRKLRTAMGGQAKWAISGGAPLGKRLGYFYLGIGLKILEGYGLTETTAPTAVNLPGENAVGTVGPPVAGTAFRVADDGEILIQGPHVFRGYHNAPEDSAAALKDGWFHSGDIGHLDDHGRLTITGRKKEIIVTAGGKNVAPGVLEDRLRGHPLVAQCLVVGDQKPFIGALIVLDAEMLPGWLRIHNKPAITLAEAAEDPDVQASMERAVERANRAVSRAESIRKFVVLTDEWTEENEYLTPSLKLRRNMVLENYADTIDEIYEGVAIPSKDAQ